MSRILHIEARQEHVEYSVNQFTRMNHQGISSVDGTRKTVTMVNGDEHVFKVFGRGDWLRGTEWDCVIVGEDIRRYMPMGDYEFLCELVPTRVRPR